MKWLAPFRNKLALGGAVVAGTAGAAVATVTAGAAAAVWPALGYALGAGSLAVATNVFSNWSSEDIRAALRGDRKTRHDLKRVLAQTLLRCLSDDASGSVPLLVALPVDAFDRRRVAELVAFWRRQFEAALSTSDPAALERLFPGAESEQELLDIGTAMASDSLWLAFYRDTLGRFDSAGNLVVLCGGVEHLERELPNALAAVFPAQLAAVLGDDGSRGAWIAFQKAILQDVRGALVEQSAATVEQRNAIDALLARFDDVCEEQRYQLQRVDLRFDRIDDCLRAAADVAVHNTRLLNDVRAVLRAEHDPPLYIPEREAQTPLGVRALRFSERLCATLGRDDELQRLDAFLDADAPLLWWGIVGAAGMGKSHLGLHVVEQRGSHGWHAGFLETDTQWPSSELHLHKWQPRAPTLIVVDYASARAPQLLTLITRLYERREALPHRVRVLLLDRPGELAPAFAENVHVQMADEENWSRAQRCLFGFADATPDTASPVDALKSPASTTTRIGDEHLLSLRVLERRHWRPLLQQALRHFDCELTLPADDRALWRQLRQVSDNGRPLLLLAAAGAIAVGQYDSKPLSIDMLSRDRLLAAIVERDRTRIWADVAGVSRAEWNREHRRAFERAVAFVTLLGGLNWSDAAQRSALAEVMGRSTDLHSPLRHEIAAILGWNDRECALRPLEPDLFGEYLLVAGASTDRSGYTLFSEHELVSKAFALHPSRCAAVIGRIARDFPEHGLAWMRAGLDAASNGNSADAPCDIPEGPFNYGTLFGDKFVMPVRTLVASLSHAVARRKQWPEEIDAQLFALANRDPRCMLEVQIGLVYLLTTLNDEFAAQVLARVEAIGGGASPETMYVYTTGLANAVRLLSARGDLPAVKRLLKQLGGLAKSHFERDDAPWSYITFVPWAAASSYAAVVFTAEADAVDARQCSYAIAAAIDHAPFFATFTSTSRIAAIKAVLALISNHAQIGLQDVDTWTGRLSKISAVCVERADVDAVLTCLHAFRVVFESRFNTPEQIPRYAEEVEMLLTFVSDRAAPHQTALLVGCAATAIVSIRGRDFDNSTLRRLLRKFLDLGCAHAELLTSRQLVDLLADAIHAYRILREIESVDALAERLAQLQDAHAIDDPVARWNITTAMENLVLAYSEVQMPDNAAFWMRRLWEHRADPAILPGQPPADAVLHGLEALLVATARGARPHETVDWLQRLRDWLTDPTCSDERTAARAIDCFALALQLLGESSHRQIIRAAADAFVGDDVSYLKRLPAQARITLGRCILTILDEYVYGFEHDQAQRWCRVLLAVVPDDSEAPELAIVGIAKAMHASMNCKEWRALLEWTPLVRTTYAANAASETLTLFASYVCFFVATAITHQNDFEPDATAQWNALIDDIETRTEQVSSDAALPLILALRTGLEAFGARDDVTQLDNGERLAQRVIAKLSAPAPPHLMSDLAIIACQATTRAHKRAADWSALVRPHLDREDWPRDDYERSMLVNLTTAVVGAAGLTNDDDLLNAWEPFVDRCATFDHRTTGEAAYLLQMAESYCVLARRTGVSSAISRVDQAHAALNGAAENLPEGQLACLSFASRAVEYLEASATLQDADRLARAAVLAAEALTGSGPMSDQPQWHEALDKKLGVVRRLVETHDTQELRDLMSRLEGDTFLAERLRLLRNQDVAAG